MKKYLVTIKFIYSGVAKSDYDCTSKTKRITIGIYDSFDDACIHGNDVLKTLESKFKLHKFPDGTTASRDRLGKRLYSFGGRKSLVTDSAYLKTPFNFYLKIDTLNYGSITDTIDDVLDSVKEFRSINV